MPEGTDSLPANDMAIIPKNAIEYGAFLERPCAKGAESVKPELLATMLHEEWMHVGGDGVRGQPGRSTPSSHWKSAAGKKRHGRGIQRAASGRRSA